MSEFIGERCRVDPGEFFVSAADIEQPLDPGAGVPGFRRFSVRNAHKVRGEWHLVCLALNIKRMAGLAVELPRTVVIRDSRVPVRSGGT